VAILHHKGKFTLLGVDSKAFSEKRLYPLNSKAPHEYPLDARHEPVGYPNCTRQHAGGIGLEGSGGDRRAGDGAGGRPHVGAGQRDREGDHRQK